MFSKKILNFLILLIFLISVNCDYASSGDFPSTTDETSINQTNKDDYISINTEEAYEEDLPRTWFELEHEIIEQQADQPTSGERFVAIHVDAVGAKEQLRPTLVGLENMATKFLPSNYVFTNVISATREVVAGIKYELEVNALDENKIPVVCNLEILEQPWITTKWGDKHRRLLYSNCSQEDEFSGNTPEVNLDGITYQTNPIFDQNRNIEMTDERLKNLESMIIVPYAAEKFKKPISSRNDVQIDTDSRTPDTNDENNYRQPELSENSQKFLDEFFSTKVASVDMAAPPKNRPNEIDEEFVKVVLPPVTTAPRLDDVIIEGDTTAEPTLAPVIVQELSSENNINSDNNENINLQTQISRSNILFSESMPNSNGGIVVITDDESTNPNVKSVIDGQIESLLNEYLNSELGSTDPMQKIEYLSEDEQVARQFNNIMKNVDEQMKRDGLDITAIRNPQNNIENSDSKTKDCTSSEEKKEKDKTNESSSKSSSEEAENINPEVKSRTVRSINTEKEFLYSIISKALYEIDRLDNDDYKRVVLDVISFKKLDNNYIFMLKIADSKCIEDENFVNFCKDTLIKGSHKKCLMEVVEQKNEVKVKQSECIPDNAPETPHTVHKRSADQNYPPGSARPTTPEQQQHIQELIETSLASLNGDAQGHSYRYSKTLESTVQVVAGSLYKIKAEFIHHDDNTNLDTPTICSIKIWDRPWLPKGREIEYNCDNQKEYKFRQRRSLDTPNEDISPESLDGGINSVDSNEEEQEVLNMIQTTLPVLNTKTNGRIYKFSKIINATQHIVSGIIYRIHAEFTNQDEANNKESKVICFVKIWDQPWLPDGREVTYDCNDGNKYTFKTESILMDISEENTDMDESPTGTVEKADPSDSVINDLIISSLKKLNGDAEGHSYKLLNILESTKQVVSGMLYKIKARFNHHVESTKVDTEVICEVSIWDQPWIPNGREVTYKCDNSRLYNFRQKRSVSDNDIQKQILIGGPISTSPEEDDEIKSMLASTLGELNGKADGHSFSLRRIINSTKQVVSGILYKISAEFIKHEPTINKDTIVLCNVEIWDQPWKKNGRKVTYKCPENNHYNFRQKRSSKIDEQKSANTNNGANLLGGAIAITSENRKEHKKIKDMVKNALVSVNGQDENNNYRLSKILNATKQSVAGVLYKIKAEFTLDSTHDTVLCNIEIYERPWEATSDYRHADFNCDNEQKYNVRARRSIENDDDDMHDIHKFRDYTLDSAMRNNFSDHHIFILYKDLYNKSYQKALEHNMRFRIFKNNLKKIHDLNRHEQGTATYGITEFADLTFSEYRLKTGLIKKKYDDENNHIHNPMAQIPDFKLPREFDWREKNVVSPVKNQGNCGSCWAFSVVGNIEGLHAIKTGVLEEYSEQELLDCDDIDKACNGGLPDDAYKAIEQIGGLEIESEYPYKAHQNKCQLDKSKVHVQVSGAVDLPKNETAMALWLLQNGPISIGINANAMQFYRAGISHPWRLLCKHSNLDHGVLIVGFGVHEYPKFNKTLPYWIVKNSWGPRWGEKGYYRVFRGDNTCGVANMPTSAVLA